MPHGESKKTVTVSYRIPVEVYEVIKRRVDKGRWDSPNQYLQELTIALVTRKHKRVR